MPSRQVTWRHDVRISHPSLPRVVALTAALLVAVSGGALAAGSTTPDEAVREYMAAVAASDAGRILDASAIDEMAEGHRFTESLDRLQAFIPNVMLAPAEYPFYVEVNRAQRANEIMSQVLMLAYGLLSGEAIDFSPIVPVDRAWAESFAAQVDPARLAGIEVMDARFPNPDLETSERYLQTAATLAATYSADELTERLVLLSFEGQTYSLGFTLLRYGDTWLVSSQSSPIGGTSTLGTATPMSVEEYEDVTSAGD
jgi:hypothetical protein